MLTVTENAVTVIRGLLNASDEPDGAGLRIGPKAGEADLAVEIAPAPIDGDEVIEDHGARVFLDSSAAARLADRELDALIDSGSVRFLLREQPESAT